MATPDEDPKFEVLLEFLRRNRGFDFSGYKRASLMRRVNKRMETVGLDDYGNYTDYLEVHPEEFDYLFDTLLINVTNFFRDEPAWDFLAKEVVPRIVASNAPSLRVWCAGVASGEEAYTIAILLAEAMGEGAFLERVKIYATDMDENALNQARQASYTEESIQAIPEQLRRRYFEQNGGRHVFRADMRRAIIFGRHDLVQDAPISRLDLLICRNTLMYFNIETQSRILARFYFGLKDEGVLFLGKAEMLLTHSDLFTPIDLRFRIFRKTPRPDGHERLPLVGLADEVELNHSLVYTRRLQAAAFETNQSAQIILNADGLLAIANNRARGLFGLFNRDIGRLFSELELSYRPIELRSRIDQAYAERRPVVLADVSRDLPNDKRQYLDVEVVPLQDNDGTWIGVSITFTDVTRRHELQEEIQRSRQDLETAYEELQSANEELETTNEELQSTVEELQTTNEELQSTNEELETMNEELQSTNAEQETLNTQLQQRTQALDESNAFLSSVLSSLNSAVIVLDRDRNVIVWNTEAEEYWGLRDSEVQGRSFFNLDIGLPVEQLASPIRTCLSDKCEPNSLVVEATNRRGKKFRCRVNLSELSGPHGERNGVILLMENQDREA